MKTLALVATAGPTNGSEDRSEPMGRPVEAVKAGDLAAFELLMRQYERLVLVLRDLEGLSTEEVARTLGTTEATVRSQISKARVKARDFLERYFRRRP